MFTSRATCSRAELGAWSLLGWRTGLLASVILVVAIVAAWPVPAWGNTLTLAWIPVVIAVAYAGPRATGALAMWVIILTLVVGWAESYYLSIEFWVRVGADLLTAFLMVWLARKLFRQRLMLDELSFSDELTGLANRRLLLDRFDYLLSLRIRHGVIAVLYIDIDEFKAINSTYGHTGGDAVLREVAQRFSECTRAEDTVCRFGGDEFVILCPAMADISASVESISARLIDSLEAPIELSLGESVRVKATIGAVAIPPGVQLASADAAINQADQLLMQQKAIAPGAYRLAAVDQFG